MKKTYIAAGLVATVVCSLTLQSCLGSFTLTDKLIGWNRQIGNKFVNELVFIAFCALPVYEVSILADVLVLNTIEFWSGTNPVADTGTRRVKGSDGYYLVTTDRDGYTVTDEKDGSTVRFDYNRATQTWSVSAPGQGTFRLFSWVDADHIELPIPGSDRKAIVELSQEGLYAYRDIAANQPLFALK